MAKRYISFPLADGDAITVEVDASDDSTYVDIGRDDETVHRATQTFENALAKIRPAAEAIVSQLRAISDQPDEVQVKFGIKLSAETGVILAAAGVEANYEVVLSWKARR